MFSNDQNEIANLIKALNENPVRVSRVFVHFARLFEDKNAQQFAPRKLQIEIKPDIAQQILSEGMKLSDVHKLEDIINANREKLSDFNISNANKEEAFYLLTGLAQENVNQRIHAPSIEKTDKQQIKASSNTQKLAQQIKPLKQMMKRWSHTLFGQSQKANKPTKAQEKVLLKQQHNRNPKM